MPNKHTEPDHRSNKNRASLLQMFDEASEDAQVISRSYWDSHRLLPLPSGCHPGFHSSPGHLDDVLIVPGLIWLAMRLIPSELSASCRSISASSIDSPA